MFKIINKTPRQYASRLVFSVEIIRLGQSLLISWDINLYHEETDTPTMAR